MSSWGYTALTLAALCSLPAFCPLASAEVNEAAELHRAKLPALVDDLPLTPGRSRSAQADVKLHINSLHQTAQLGVSEGASLSSASYSVHGIKPGLPATCYGQPCSASACYPTALVTVKQHVNYVNVTAVVQFSRRYTVQYLASVSLLAELENVYFLSFLADFSADL